MAISMLKIRRPLGRLIFNMGIAIPGKTVFLIETAPWFPLNYLVCFVAKRLFKWGDCQCDNEDILFNEDINVDCVRVILYGVRYTMLL